MKLLLALLVSSMMGTAAHAAPDFIVSCMDSNRSLQYPAWVNYNFTTKSFTMGYVEELPKMPIAHKHVTASVEGTADVQSDKISIVGNAFQMSLILRPTSSVGRYSGTVSGPVFAPDASSDTVQNYAVDCVSL